MLRHRAVTLASLLLLLPLGAFGATVGLNCAIAWEASPSANLARFRLYRARQPKAYVKGTFAKEIAASPTTAWTTYFASCADWGLTQEGAHDLAVTAVDTAGQESDFSFEESVTVLTTGLTSPLILREDLQSYPDQTWPRQILVANSEISTIHVWQVPENLVC